jgi:F0F1-type ATP synthase epsilon subunit
MRIKLRVLAPEKIIKEDDVDYVKLETDNGSFGVMRGHVPVAARLKKSSIEYIKDNAKGSIEIDGGFARILPDEVTVFDG